MSASFQLLIATVDKTSLCESCSFSHRFGSIGTATFTLKDTAASPYIPADDAAVEIKIGGTTRWSGEVSEVSVETLTMNGGAIVSVTASDNNALTQRALVNTIWSAKTVKEILTDLTSPGGALEAVSVTLSGSQADGATVTVTAPWWTVETLLNHLSTLTGWAWWIDASKVLRMWDIGDLASGVTLSAANTNCYAATWERSRYEYRNSQWVVYGPSEVRTVTDTWTGDGASRSFTLRYNTNTPIPTPPATVTILSTGAVVLPVGVYGSTADAGLEWWYSSTGTALVQSTDFTVLSSTQQLQATYDSQFPNALNVQNTSEQDDHGLWVRADANTSIVDYDEADAWADALIRANLGRVKMPRVTCNDVTLLPGYTITVDLSTLDLGSTTCVIQAVDVSLDPANHTEVEPRVSLELSAGSEAQASTADLWRRVVTGDASGGTALGSGGGGTSGTSTFTGVLHAHLGGSRTQDYLTSSYVPIAEYQVLNCSVSGDVTFRCEVKTANAGTSVTARLYDLTAGAAVCTLSASTSVSWAEVSGAATLTAGHRYRAEVTGNNTTYGIYVGQATVEV